MYDFTFRDVHVRTREREAEPHQGSYSGGETGCFSCFVCSSAYLRFSAMNMYYRYNL